MKRIMFLFLAIEFAALNQCKKETRISAESISTALSFSKENGTGLWQVGYSATDSLDPSQFRLCTSADSTDSIGIFHPSLVQYYPYTGQNRSRATRHDPSNSWAARPGEIVMEGSNSGQYAMLRLVVPSSGHYKIKAIYEGVHYRLSSTDVHILLNSTSLFSDNIEGYGGDSTFHIIQGTHPSVTYQDTLLLQQNDVLTFAVGYGTNKSYFNDTTGLMLEIEIIDET